MILYDAQHPQGVDVGPRQVVMSRYSDWVAAEPRVGWRPWKALPPTRGLLWAGKAAKEDGR